MSPLLWARLRMVAKDYDRAGNQTSRVEGSAVEVYRYNHANQMSMYIKGNSTHRYLFAPGGERMAKVSPSGSEEWYMYDGSDVTADYARSSGGASFTCERMYVNGRSIDSKIARIDAGSPESVSFYVGDAVGSVHEMVDAQGTVVRRVLNTAWGEDLPGFTPVAEVADRHGFTQREKDAESGLMHYRARSYDPRLGRFIQRDPILGNRPFEHYAYAGNKPASRIDPTGMQDEDELVVQLHTAVERYVGDIWTSSDVGAVGKKTVLYELERSLRKEVLKGVGKRFVKWSTDAALAFFKIPFYVKPVISVPARLIQGEKLGAVLTEELLGAAASGIWESFLGDKATDALEKIKKSGTIATFCKGVATEGGAEMAYDKSVEVVAGALGGVFNDKGSDEDWLTLQWEDEDQVTGMKKQLSATINKKDRKALIMWSGVRSKDFAGAAGSANIYDRSVNNDSAGAFYDRNLQGFRALVTIPLDKGKGAGRSQIVEYVGKKEGR